MAQARQSTLNALSNWATNTNKLAQSIDLENHDTKLPVRTIPLRKQFPTNLLPRKSSITSGKNSHR
jgi:hypothetical protein